MKEILINVEKKEMRYALLKFGKLHDLFIERTNSKQLTGNIYRGKVTNILHNIQSAFINIGEEENGFIHISDILENKKKFEEMFDMDFDIKDQQKESISQLLKINQPVIVQVVKEAIGKKGARLTSNISIAGRHLVLLPNIAHRGISKKIENKQLRDRLKKILKSIEMPKDMGLICRTASADASQEMIVKEAKELLEKWESIIKKFHSQKHPSCLYEESDFIKRALLIALDNKINRILIDDHKTYLYCKKRYQEYESEHPLKIEYYKNTFPMFERFGIEDEIDKSLKRKIWLNSGGYLFFERTEAMHTIDVNSGKSLQNTMKDLEEAIVQINLEAAKEIARQFKIRNIGGLIICDFIDMRYRKNQKRILEKLKESMRDDYAKCTILGMSEFGLIEMTRQRTKEALSQTIFTDCPYCLGRGNIKSYETLSIELDRLLKKILYYHKEKNILLTLHPELLKKLNQKEILNEVKKMKSSINFKTKDTLHLNDYLFSSEKTGKILE